MEHVETGLEIAVIGLAVRFPGASDSSQFWQNLENGVESIAFLSPQELRAAGAAEDTISQPGFVQSMGGALEHLFAFDAAFFNYTPPEAEQMAPQFRLLHGCTWTVLEDAGCDPERFQRPIGLYIGASSTHDWETLVQSAGNGSSESYTAHYLNNRDFLGTLLAYKLNLKGPAFSVNTTCSTSLVAVHLACQGLLSGDCDLALAGGVSVRLGAEQGYMYEEGMILSPDGHCRAFDALAKGVTGGDGAGMVALKRLEDAREDHDFIYAVIKGSALNNDGSRKVGYTAPSIEGQANVIRKALSMAEVEARTIDYVETHGTATPLGDVTEMAALKLAFDTEDRHFCAIGSVKTNFGHLGEAAGAAGFIKTVLALHNKKIPPSLHFSEANPKIDIDHSPFYVNTGLKPWPVNSHPPRAGVSSFGIGGTNAHVILEAWPLNQPGAEHREQREFLILLSAKTPEALDKMTQNLLNHFLRIPSTQPPRTSDHPHPVHPIHPTHPSSDILNIAFTLQTGRRRFSIRRKLVCSSIPEAIEKLSNLPSRAVQTYAAEPGDRDKKAVFIFPGLGPQYSGMGRDLYRCWPVFKEAVDDCLRILNPVLDYDLKTVCFPDDAAVQETQDIPDINRFDVSQLAIFVFEYALAQLVMNWGITPFAMIGYSFGEYAAACVSGVFRLEDILHLLVIRGKLIGALPGGTMLTVPLPVQEVKDRLPANLSIAIDNGSSCVVSGDSEAVREFERRMKEQKILCAPLPAGHALHSPMMDDVLQDFEREVAAITLHPPRIPYISTVTGQWIKTADALSPTYWAQQMRQTVRFAQGMKRLLEESNTLFIEVGPGRDISALVNREIINESGMHAVNIVKHRDTLKDITDTRYLLDKIGLLWLYGLDIDWEHLYPGSRPQRTPLPAYPFEEKEYRAIVDSYKNNPQAALSLTPQAPGSNYYRLTWEHTLPPVTTVPPTPAGPRLIFGDDRFKSFPGDNIIVSRGKTFSGDRTNGFTIDPGVKEHYVLLLETLLENGPLPATIVYAWDLEPEPCLSFDRGYYWLLYLLQALAQDNLAKSLAARDEDSPVIQIEVLLDGVFSVTGEETVKPEQSAVLGLCLAIPQEYANICCRVIDISLTPEQGLQRWQDWLIAEWSHFPRPEDTAVAYRGHSRWLRRLVPLHLEPVHFHPAILKPGGVYMITGGLGNDGFIRASYLAEHFQAKLVLVGRTALPDRSYWNQILLMEGDSEGVGLKIKRIRELEHMGADVLALSADVSDELDMMVAMKEIDNRFGRLDGVIHGAGETGADSARLLNSLDVEGSELHFKPKIRGLYVLEKMLKDRAIDFCLLTSSVVSVIGGIGQGAYTAASIFMDRFASAHHRERSGHWLSLNWQGSSADDTVDAFKQVLSPPLFPGLNQVLYSSSDLIGLVKERTQRAGQNLENRDGTFYERPELSTAYEAPGDELETRLADIWQRFFGIDKIGIDDDLFDLGGDSLKAINILSILNKELNADVPVTLFFDRPNIRGVAAYLREQGMDSDSRSEKGTGFQSIEAVELKEYYVASSAQKRMFLFQQMNPRSTAYNTPMARLIEGSFQADKIETIFKRLVQRHESLRTSIEIIDEEPVQRIREHCNFRISYYDAQPPGCTENITQQIMQFVQPFDLSHAPFLRVALMPVKDTVGPVETHPITSRHPSQETHPTASRHPSQEGRGDPFILLIDMHHIIADGLSMGIFLREFMALMKGDALTPLTIQYKEYAEWQKREQQGERMKAQERFWLDRFAQEVTVLDWPQDFPRPGERDFKGGSFSFTGDRVLSDRVKALAAQEGATLFMTLLALYNVFLSKLCNQDEIVVGAPVAGRFHADLEPVMGMFINTLALKNNPKGKKQFREFLKDVRQHAFDAFANQDYQYDELVDKAGLTGSSGRNPLFDTMLMLQNLDIPEFQLEGLTIKAYEFDWQSSKFDLTLLTMETAEGLDFTFEYNANLFLPDTVQRFSRYFLEVMTAATTYPDRCIKELDMLPADEKQRLLTAFNDTADAFPTHLTIFQLLAEHAEKIPGAPALVFEDRMVTFGEFQRRSNRFAHYLQTAAGVRTGDRIAVCMERSIQLIISLAAIMTAGAAYVPLDPALPVQRLRIIFQDASIHCAVSQSTFSETMAKLQQCCPDFTHPVLVDEVIHRLEDYPGTMPVDTATAADPAYVMYTSGSSGTPKGVVVEHRTIVNTLIWRKNYYGYSPGDVSLRNPPYFFDSSVTDIFTPLLGGARLVLTAEADRIDPGVLSQVIVNYGVSHFIVVPAFYNLLLEEIGSSLTGLKKICCAGEHFPDELVMKHFKRLPHVRIVNEYGPTENSVNSTEYELSPNSPKALIGKPISNVRVYVLDRYLNPVPIGITGELCLAGSSLARGYLNNPELTNETFIVKDFHHRDDGERIYLSGDLARWHSDGNLEFMGRLDKQVKIRGIRVEIGEIENLLMRHQEVKECIVLARSRDTHGELEKYLCGYIVPSAKTIEEQPMKEYLALSLPAFMVPAHIMFIDAIPFTATGKIDYAALPEPALSEHNGHYLRPRSRVEHTLVDLFSGVLDIAADKIGIEQDFFRLGGNSLKAARLASRIHKALEVRLPLADIFKTPTVMALAERISRSENKRFLNIHPVEERDYYPLSFNQRRLWVIAQLEPDSSAYHIPGRIDLEGEVDREKVKWAIHKIIERHSSLRTGFTKIKDTESDSAQPVQFILPAPPLDTYLDTLDLSGITGERIPGRLKEALDTHGSKPFVLSRPPLVRFLLIDLPGPSLCLGFTMHHIIGDGFSLEILKKDFMALLLAGPDQKRVNLPVLDIEYKDFAHWQNSGFGDIEIKEGAHRFWRRVLEKALTPVALPGQVLSEDSDRKGGSYRFTLEKSIKDRLKELARQQQTSLFTVMLALFNILLSRVSGQKDILLGLPVSGRDHEALQHIAGFFVNTVILDTHIIEDETFLSFLDRVNKQVMDVLQHQSYPLESVLEDLRMPFPPINVFFNMLNIDGAALEQNMDCFEARHMDEAIEMKFELMMYVSEYANGIELYCNYRKAVIDPVTTASLMDRYVRITEFFTAQPEKRVIDFKSKKRSLKRTK